MTWRLPGVDDGSFAQQMLKRGCPWLEELSQCPQDPVHHAEGDVLTHVLWVCRELHALESFQACAPEEQQILAWAALLHDVAKPRCTITEEGRIRSPGHALKGSLQARRLLWELECPFLIREEIVGLVRYHMTCFWALERDDPERLARRISLSCRCSLLAILAEADARGRQCEDGQDLLDRIALFAELCKEAGCWEVPAQFASSVGRFRYFEGKWHDPDSAPFEDFKCQVTLMSGLPAAGKDTWLREHCPALPVISLDEIRQHLGISHTAHQGRVLEYARERAREFLREGVDFAWNATNISQRYRQTSLALFFDYGAKVRIVYLERPRQVMLSANEQRNSPVPAAAYAKMVKKWEVPNPTEAHMLEWVTR